MACSGEEALLKCDQPQEVLLKVVKQSRAVPIFALKTVLKNRFENPEKPNCADNGTKLKLSTFVF